MRILALIILICAAVPSFAQDQAKALFSNAEVKERIARLKNKDEAPERRLEAIKDLGKAGTKASRKALLSALKKEKDPHTRATIVNAYGSRPDKAAVKELLEIARADQDADARMSAVRALGYAKDADVVGPLIEKFRDEAEELGIRLRAADALTRYPTDEVFNVYVAALGNASKPIKVQALVSLFNGFGSDPARVRPHLERLTADPEAGETAKVYLKRLGN